MKPAPHTRPQDPRQSARSRKPGWLAHPVLSLVLAALWLLMQQSLAPAHLLSAAVLALVVPRLVHGFLGPASRVHSVPAAARCQSAGRLPTPGSTCSTLRVHPCRWG